MLLHLPDLIDAAALAAIRRALDDPAAPWQDGRASAGPQAAAVKRNEQLDPAWPPAQQAQARVLQALERSSAFFAAALPRRLVPPRFNRCTPAAPGYGDHVDQAVRLVDGQRLRTDLSCTVFLTDPGDCDGGELVIRHGLGETRVKGRAGSAVLYPATSLHRVEPVTRGVRLAAFLWVESLVPGEAERSLLHELDGALTSLRARLGESDETLRLMGVYHNLLRQWTTT